MQFAAICSWEAMHIACRRSDICLLGVHTMLLAKDSDLYLNASLLVLMLPHVLSTGLDEQDGLRQPVQRGWIS